jgi:hypothetical protein
MKSVLWRSIVFLTLAANAGCASERETDASNGQPGMMRADSGVELRVFLPRDTISVRDSSSVEVQYLIVNGPNATRFSNEPDLYMYRVEREDGRAVRPKKGGAPVTGSYGRQVFLVLPANAWLGQTRDLRCLIHGGGYGEAVSTERDCLAEYDFSEPGTYHVIVEYQSPDIWKNLDSLIAVGDTSDILVADEPLVEGRRLADTATLVVRPD